VKEYQKPFKNDDFPEMSKHASLPVVPAVIPDSTNYPLKYQPSPQKKKKEQLLQQPPQVKYDKNHAIFQCLKNPQKLGKDQADCRVLQKKLEEEGKEFRDIVFSKLYDHFFTLMYEPFGNYLC
jgi:hypothetical protein